MNAQLLAAGVDILKINVKLKDQVQVLPVYLEIRCSIWQEQAREQSKLVATTLTFHDACMTMLPNGAPAWKYIVKNDCLQVIIGARLRIPMIAKATLSSALLFHGRMRFAQLALTHLTVTLLVNYANIYRRAAL